MARVYAGARQTLVLDFELEDIPTSDSELDKIAVVALLSCSPWMSRSWTLQEGSLSLRVMVKFKNALLDLKALLRNIRSPIFHGLMSNSLRMPFLKLEDMQRSNSFGPSDMWFFELIWDSLLSRSTSEADDIHGILQHF